MIIKLTIKLFLAITLLSACSLKFTNSDISLDEQEKFFSKLTSVKAIKASLDIKATGLLGNFFHEQGQIIVQEPQNLFFFISSFKAILNLLYKGYLSSKEKLGDPVPNLLINCGIGSINLISLLLKNNNVCSTYFFATTSGLFLSFIGKNCFTSI